MEAKQIILEPMFDSEPEFAEIFDRMLRMRLIEYISELEVEVVWNYGDDATRGLSVAVMPANPEPISNKMPIVVLPLSALLDEWVRRIDGDLEDKRDRVKRFRQVEDLQSHLLSVLKRMGKIAEQYDTKEERRATDRAEIERLMGERHPELDMAAFYARHYAAEHLIEAEVRQGEKGIDDAKQDAAG